MKIAAWMALALAVVFSRLWALDADPSGVVHAHIVTDEGWWAHNARAFLLTGQWILDDHNPPLWIAPLHTFLVWASNAAFGPSIWATRLPGAIAGIAICVIGALALAPFVANRWAWAGAALLGVNAFLWSHARVGFVESLQLAILCIAALAALRAVRAASVRGEAGWAAAAALALVVSTLAKPSGVAVGAAIACWLVCEAIRERRPAGLVGFAIGGALATAVLALAYVLPNADAILGELRDQAAGSFGRRGWLSVMLSFGHTDRPADGQMLSLLAPLWWALVLGVVLRGLGDRPPVAGKLGRLAWWWIGFAVLMTAAQSYQPDRRMLLAVPPLVFLLVLHLAEGIDLPQRASRTAGPARLVLPLLLLASSLAVTFFEPLTQIWQQLAPARSEQALIVLAWASAGAVATLALGLLRAVPWPARTLRVHPALLLLPLVWFDGTVVVRGLVAPTYTFREAARDLGRRVATEEPTCRVVQGKIANTLVLESQAFAFHTRTWAGGIEMNLGGWERYRPRYVVVGRWPDGRPWAPPIVPPIDDLEQVAVRGLWPGPDGAARLFATIYRVPDALGPCRDVREAAAAEERYRDGG